MGNEMVRYESLDDLQRLAKLLAASNYFDAKGNDVVAVAQIATKILAGRELGYGPFASVQGIHVIQGRPALSANIMAAAVKNSPRYDYRVRKMDANECAIEFFERCEGKRESLGVSTFTIDDARKAQVKNTDKFPRNMLFARAMSNGVRWFCPDVFSGNTVYTPDELGADVDDSGVVVVDGSTGEIVEERKSAPATTNGNGNKPAPQPTAPPSGESLDAASAEPTDAERQQVMDRFHAVGRATFSPKAWDELRVIIVTNLGQASSTELTTGELNALADSFKQHGRKWQAWQKEYATNNKAVPPVELAFGA